MKRNKSTCFKFLGISALLLCIIIYCLLSWLSKPLKSLSADMKDPSYFIAHAGGMFNHHIYTNSKEAVLNSLRKGYQLIELDLHYTADNVLVCMHDSNSFKKNAGLDPHSILTYDLFKQAKIHGELTPLSMDSLIKIMETHPFRLITDGISDTLSLNHFFAKEHRKDIMVETISLKDYIALKESGYVPMLTIGILRPVSFLKYIVYSMFCNSKIEWIVVNIKSSKNLLRMIKRLYGVHVAMYTSNSGDFIHERLGKEVDLFYTDDWDFEKK